MSDALRIRGGVGGIRARTDDMEHAARILAVVGADVGLLGARLVAVAADPLLLATAARAAPTFARAEAATAAAVAGPHGLVRVSARLELVGLRLQAAALACRTTEEEAAALAHVVDVAAVGGLGLAVVGVVPSTVPVGLGAALPRPRSQGFGSAEAGALEAFAGALPGTIPQFASLGQLAARGTPFLREGTGVAVAAPAVPLAAPRGLADVLDGVASCYPENGAAPGTVRVVRVAHPDGSLAWVVEIPGTQTWSPVAGADPFDLSGDVTSMAGRVPAAARSVEMALTAAGARTGQPVLLAGHSLGGMVAAGLAADPAFRSRFDVTHVLTAGSPVASYRVPAGVQVLALEHDDDLVPALDGARDPDRPSWVTVRRPAHPGALLGDPGGAHDLAAYRRTAALADASADPSVVAWRRGAAAFLAGSGVTARVVVVRTARVVGR